MKHTAQMLEAVKLHGLAMASYGAGDEMGKERAEGWYEEVVRLAMKDVSDAPIPSADLRDLLAPVEVDAA